MGANDKYCLRWNDFRSNISLAFQDLRSSAEFFDVTLATEDIEVRAHRVILSACSPHFRDLLKRHSTSNEQNTNLIIYLRGVSQRDLEAILEFMYNGEVNVSQEDLNSFLAVAEDLKVKGLTQNLGGSNQSSLAKDSPSRPQASNSSRLQSCNASTTRPKPQMSAASKNGASGASLSPAPKKLKLEQPVVLKVKEEVVSAAAKAAKADVTPTDESFDPDEIDSEEVNPNSEQDQEDSLENNLHTEFVETEDGEMFDYDDYESESGEMSQVMVDPSIMEPGTDSVLMDGSKEEQEYLTSEIGNYLNSMSARREDGQYQCLVCARNSRDLYNQRQHIMTHMMKDSEFLDRLDHFVKSHSVQQNSNLFTCLLCRMMITRGFYMVRQHFFSKHLKEDKYTELY